MALDLNLMPATARTEKQASAIQFVGELGRVAAVPWKNEGGQTRELCVEPPQSDFAGFLWRVSVADVGADGAFSTFDGIDRTIVLLEGGGFGMYADGQLLHDLAECFVPHDFPGEQGISVQLHGAPTLDFNLMVRRERAVGKVVVLREQNSRCLPADTALLYVARGAACLSDESGLQQALRCGEFARLRDGQGARLPDLLCTPGSVVLAVCIHLKP
ncbi:HutD family protein [Herbaspirillum sp. AP02]|uniref:HutD/Ves family protein n=1 Tax=unclassified Herbaspirillum TaxID=2624150 RepID=UPI0018CAEA58|nr:HutD family protein [Herbaspirillum sp. AP02]MBG7618162.1 HutD family protein [Herbaspirillum sp. AP02]